MTGRSGSVHDELRDLLGAVDETSFDYDALVAGAKVRAGRIRRRRAIAQGVTAAVLVPTLAGAGWMISHNLTGGGEDRSVDIATRTSSPTEDSTSEAPAKVDAVTETEAAPEETTPEETTGTTAQEPDEPPFQDAAQLDEPVLGVDDQGIANQEELPDPRPVGFSPLDQYSLGTAERYRNITPILNVTGMDKGPGQGAAAHSVASWHYWDTVGGGGELTITLGLWEDSAFAMEQLTTGGVELQSSWLGPDGTTSAPTAQPWPEHEGDEDYFRTWQEQWGEDPFASHTGVGLIRQGDYLVSVSYQSEDGPSAMEVASTIAEQTAANLLALDPERASDGGGRR